MRIQNKDFPTVSKVFLEALQERFPQKDFDTSTSLRELDFHYGQRAVIQFLEAALTQEQGHTAKAHEEAEELRKQLEAKVSELKDVVVNRDETKQLAQKLKDQLNKAELIGKERLDEAELTLLQLHQVQEELERYFLDSREKEGLLLQYKEQSVELKKIISGFIA